MLKKRISMTISPDVLNSLDSIVDGKEIRSRSEAIEKVVSQHLESNKTAVFLGGGEPESLKIDGRFKPLTKIRGKLLIEYNIERLKKAGFTRLFIIGKSELIGECFKVLGNGTKFGVSIEYLEEHKTLGNAKTLQIAETSLKSSFLVLPVDNFFDFDLNYLATAHSRNNCLATLAVQANREGRIDQGVIEMAGNRIIDYEERPSKPQTFLTAAFIGMYDPKVFQYIPRGKSRWVLQTDVFSKLIESSQLHGCIVPGFYVNIDSVKDLKPVEDFLRKK